jgi:ABC-type nitrate/sulfonate/bicarbonate transport system substrate-binding protein
MRLQSCAVLSAFVVAATVMACSGAAPAPSTARSESGARPAAAATDAVPVAPGAQAAPRAQGSPPPAAQPGRLEKVTYGIVSHNPFHWVAIVAQAKGLFEPYGIEFELVLTRSAPAAMAALAGGSLDLATTSPAASWDVQQRTPGLKQVMEIASVNPYVVIAQPQIANYEDVRGQTIAGQSLTSGADIETLRILLAEHGLEYPRDYDILAIGSVAERHAALLANQVALAAMLPPNSFELVDRGKKLLDVAANYPFFRDVTIVNVLAREAWYTENPEVARRFIQGYVAATRWLYDPANREEAITLLTDTTHMERRFAEQTYDQWVRELRLYPLNPRVNPDNLAQAYANLRRLGQAVPDDLAGLVDNRMVDEALR